MKDVTIYMLVNVRERISRISPTIYVADGHCPPNQMMINIIADSELISVVWGFRRSVYWGDKMLIRVNTLKELKELHDKGIIGNGTFNTGKCALEQGKPLFVGGPDE